MNITVNGEEKVIEEALTVEALLGELDISQKGIAVELNREIVPRGRHGEVTLNEGDVLEIVRMVGGG